MWAAVPDSIYRDHYLMGEMRSRRGGLIWYNPVTSPVFERDLFPDLDPEEGDDRKSVLTVHVDPTVAIDTLGTIPRTEAWVGLTQGLSPGGADFTRKQYIEIWINDFRDPELRSGDPLMRIDLGVINEDAEWSATALPNGRRESEDSNQDGILDRSEQIFEDTGLDSLLSADEPGYSGPTNPDPNQDDFALDSGEGAAEPNNPAVYAKVNRFEENSHLDDEDVNRDTVLQSGNSNNYFEYTIRLADTLFVETDVYQDYGVADSPDNGPNGWRLFRIPIDMGKPVGMPSLALVRHMRIWFSGFPDSKLLQIAEIRVEGDVVPPPEPHHVQFVAYDIEYIPRRFFFLVDPVDPFLTGVLRPPGDPAWVPPPVIDSLTVWRDDKNQANNGSAVPGVAYLDPRLGAPVPTDSVDTFYDPLTEQEDFTVRNDIFVPNVALPGGGHERFIYPVLDVLRPLGSQEVLAATFRATFTLPGGGTRVVRYGAVSSDGKILAKALCIPESEFEILDASGYILPENYWYPVRRLEIRSIYSLRGSIFDYETLIVRVHDPSGEDHFPGDERATYLRGLGIDRENRSGAPLPDDLMDRHYVYPALGVIVLPDLRPFSPSSADSVWPFFRTDLLATPPVRPRLFSNEDANRAVYDKRSDAPGRPQDRRYSFDISYEGR